MAGHIPPQFIEALLQRINILDVITDRIELKKAGREYTACCPFHSEKTPSFTVSPQKQFYHCFGCGAHGNSIRFLMEYENQSFVEAVTELAQLASMPIPQAHSQETVIPDYQPLYTLMEQANTYFQQQLRQPFAHAAVAYLKKRGISGHIAKHYQIGYAPAGWDNLLNLLGNNEQRRQQLLQCGLIIAKEQNKGYYDRFRHRIIFPIRNVRGKTIGFGGRVLDDNKPKYLNSPETPLFQKGKELYGLFEAQQKQRQLSQILLVEGYMDTIVLAQYGFYQTVATLGTATTSDHLQRLFRLADDIVFCFDGDKAGRKAAWRALENSLPLLNDKITTRYMFLPEKEDPDSLIQSQGANTFQTLIHHAVPFSRFFFIYLQQGIQLDSLEGQARFAQQARILLNKMPDSILKQQMIQRLTKITQIKQQQLGLHTSLPPASTKKLSTYPPKNSHTIGNITPIHKIIRYLLNYPYLAKYYPQYDVLQKLNLPASKLLSELLQLLSHQPDLNTASIIEHWQNTPEQHYLEKLAIEPLAFDNIDSIEQDFHDLFALLKRQYQEKQIDSLLQKEKQQGLNDEERKQLMIFLTTR